MSSKFSGRTKLRMKFLPVRIHPCKLSLKKNISSHQHFTLCNAFLTFSASAWFHIHRPPSFDSLFLSDYFLQRNLHYFTSIRIGKHLTKVFGQLLLTSLWLCNIFELWWQISLVNWNDQSMSFRSFFSVDK